MNHTPQKKSFGNNGAIDGTTGQEERAGGLGRALLWRASSSTAATVAHHLSIQFASRFRWKRGGRGDGDGPSPLPSQHNTTPQFGVHVLSHLLFSSVNIIN